MVGNTPHGGLVENIGIIAVSIIGGIFGIQKLLNGWKGNNAESSIITLMRSELERMSAQNTTLSNEISRLHTEIMNLNKELQKLAEENQHLQIEVTKLKGNFENIVKGV